MVYNLWYTIRAIPCSFVVNTISFSFFPRTTSPFIRIFGPIGDTAYDLDAALYPRLGQLSLPHEIR
jgi:hypothetical protein